jgi:homoserine dehydrogenase
VLADITALLSSHNISMKAFLQHPHQPGETVQLVLTTHETQEASMQKALAAIAKLQSVKEAPYMIRIEHL